MFTSASGCYSLGKPTGEVAAGWKEEVATWKGTKTTGERVAHGDTAAIECCAPGTFIRGDYTMVSKHYHLLDST